MFGSAKNIPVFLLWLCAFCSSASADDVLFFDTFNRSDNYDVDASATGMSGSLSPIVYAESFEGSGAGSIQVLGSKLQMATGAGMSSMYLEHNFIDASILSAGGFTVKLDILEINGGDNPQDRFGGFGIGLTRSQAQSATDSYSGATALRGLANGTGAQAVCDFYIDLALDGNLRAWSGNTLLSTTNVAQTYGQIWVDFLMPSFDANQTVVARIYFNGRQQDLISFTWDQSNQNYIGISARASNYVRMDNLTIMPYHDIITDKVDVTGNGAVDIADLHVLADQWLYGYNVPSPSADINEDCTVNLNDLSALAHYWPSWKHYQNPVIDLGKKLADPTVMYHNGVYYLYATGDSGTDNPGYRVYTSSNLVNWTRGGLVFSGRIQCWAPDVWRDPVTGKFYLYYTAKSNYNTAWMCIGVAESTSPLGPFTDTADLYENAIDAHLFCDDNGSLYLYYVQQPGFNISVTRMSDPRTPSGSPTVIIYPQSPWETIAPTAVTEGPWVIKRNSKYYMLYSGSHAAYPNYAVGYATSASPMGPFTRAAHNPIVMRSDGVYGPGHGCAVTGPDGNLWHVYHQKRNITDNEFNRYICLDRLWFDQVGNLYGKATRGSYQIAPTEQ